MERFIRSTLDTYPLGEQELETVMAHCDEIFLPKGTVLVREGEVNSSLYLIKSGVLRAYRNDEQRETTLWFALTGEVAFSSWGYTEGTTARIEIAASCDSTVLCLSKENAESLFGHSPSLSAWGRRIFERALLITDIWMVEMVKPLARDRYMTLSEKMPEILQSVPLKDIAAYLGVTPQSLSRIRAGLVKKKHI